MPIGTGVLPFNRRPLELLIQDVRELGIPEERFWMGIGWGESSSGALTRRNAVAQIHSELDARVIVGAVGPNMTRLAGEIGDGVSFTWWFREAVEESRELLAEGAARANREPPPVYSYIRCALLPQAEDAMNEVADRYDQAGSFQRLFRSHGKRAHDTVVTGTTAAELRPGIKREEEVLDYAIIRAITADESAESILELRKLAGQASSRCRDAASGSRRDQLRCRAGNKPSVDGLGRRIQRSAGRPDRRWRHDHRPGRRQRGATTIHRNRRA
ncbi:MAG: LLM class flavin-dependent oxidoreductase [Thermomicrobiales bacterium]